MGEAIHVNVDCKVNMHSAYTCSRLCAQFGDV